MKRRDFLKKTAAFAIAPSFSNSNNNNYGWIVNYKNLRESLYSVSELKNFGETKTACLWKAYSAVRNHPWIPHNQVGGDCVAHAAASCIDLLTCCRIVNKKKEKYLSNSSTDMIYSGGRNLIANYQRGPGMEGDWAVRYLKEYGNLLRINYPPYDLRPYTRETLSYWNRNGIPESLQKIAKEHPITDYVLVKSWEEVRDAVSAGYPVIFCSSLGVNNERRDNDGFVKPSGRWAHAWTIAGVQSGRRPGACLINSHGTAFGSGPKTHSQPDGSVWIDAKYIDYYVKRHFDSYALTAYKGFPVPEKRYILW